MSSDTVRKIITEGSVNAVLELFPSFPLVLVTTQTNIITVGQIHYFTMSPLRIGIAIAHCRFSYSLLKKEQEFIINVPGEDIIDAVKTCGSVSGKDHDKFQEAGLTREDGVKVKAVGIKECGAQIECIVDREIPFENRTWFIGKVVAARRNIDHNGNRALLCGRVNYHLPGKIVAPRY